MKQFESGVPNEYLKDLTKEVASAIGITIDVSRIDRAAENEGEPGENCVCIFRKNESFVLVDVQNNDWIMGFVVRCEDCDAEVARNIVLKWDKITREQYHQDIPEDIEDRFGKEKSLLNDIIKVHGISI